MCKKYLTMLLKCKKSKINLPFSPLLAKEGKEGWLCYVFHVLCYMSHNL